MGKPSYFAVCERDDEGRCKPSGAASTEGPKSRLPKKPDKPQESSGGISLKPTKQRAFDGNTVALKNQLGKQEAGKLGESVIISWLKSKGFSDAQTANTERNNYPVDLVQDHELIECKTGSAGNGAAAQQWRITIGQPGKAEQAAIAKMSPDKKAKWHAAKQKACLDRKKQVLADAEKKAGRKVKPATITTIINPDTKTVDLYKFSGWHQRIGWNSPEAKSAYVGSYKYGS